jgi:Fe-S cluster biogenesis protein NfuA
MTVPSRHATVKAAIDEVIRPLIEADGGGIELVNVTDDEVLVRFLNAYAGCPGSHFIRTGVIEPVLRQRLGMDVAVRIILGNSPA